MLRYALLLAASLFTLSRSAFAVDTVEPFALGASDIELYAGCDGLGASASDIAVGNSFQLGYGLAEHVSAYLNGSVTSDRHLQAQEENLTAGLFGRVIESKHVDLELFLDFGVTHSGAAASVIASGLELNLDLDRMGMFLTAWESLSGRASSETSKAERTFDTELGLGGYVDVAEGHQLLAFYDSILHHVPESGQRTHEVGAVALGYNVMVSDAIELINETSCDLPQSGEMATFGVSTGILVTLP